MTSCSNYDDTRPQEDEKSTEYFVKFNDGQNNIELRNAQNNVSARAFSGNGFGSLYEESTVFTSLPSSLAFQISFSKLFYSTPSPLQLDSLFALGRYTNFIESTYNNVLVGITYVDAKGLEWTTEDNGIQPGSVVQITSVEPVSAKGFRYKVKGRFNCRLYNGTVQNVIVNNGEFTIKMGFLPN